MNHRIKNHHPRQDVRCGVTGKIIFKSDVAATKRGMEIMHAFRTYKCEYCNWWHLTTKVN